jgi:predicted ester cyclase
MTAPISTQPTSASVSAVERNKRNVRRLFEDCFNRGDLAMLDELIAPEFAGPHGEGGPAAFRAIVSTLRTAIPDIRYEIEDVVAEGDKVAVRWHWTGTHRGPYRGFAAGDTAVVAATGNAIVDPGIGIFQLRDGKIVGASLQTDRLGFLQGIGVVPPTATLLRPRGSARP